MVMGVCMEDAPASTAVTLPRMADREPVILGIAGMGGFARQIAKLITQHGPASNPPVRLVAVSDPSPEQHRERARVLRGQGIEPLVEFDELLDRRDVEAVWLPLPIDLHRPFTRRALKAGKAVMCEKPAAGCLQDVDAMIAARDEAGLPCAIGFQDIYDSGTLPLKRRLLAGELGTIRSATLHACWPRPTSYFARSTWAGRLERDGVWVLDSPANNALSHFVNLALFLLGPEEATTARPVRVEAELYRAADIENYDTCSLRIHLQSGASVLVLLTHACQTRVQPVIRIGTDRGEAVWDLDSTTLRAGAGAGPGAGSHELSIERTFDKNSRMLERFAKLVRGIDDPEIAVATLEVARAHTLVVNAASESAAVVPIGAEHLTPIPTGEAGDVIHAVPGIEEVFARCAASESMLHESGLLGFTSPAAVLDVTGYTRFGGVAGVGRGAGAKAGEEKAR